MLFCVRQLKPAERTTVATWAWRDAPLETVCLGRDHDEFAVVDEQDTLVGYCSFGRYAMVPMLSGDEQCADVAWGLDPEFVGQGNGAMFIRAVAVHGQGRYPSRIVRAAIRESNQRSLRAAAKAGFTPVDERSGRIIVVYGAQETSSA